MTNQTNKNKTIRLLRATALTVVFPFILGVPASEARGHSSSSHSQQGWVISQSSNFAGTVFSEVTPTALRMKVGRLGLILITKAPDWKAYIYNENTRNYVELPYSDWQKKFIFGQTEKYKDQYGHSTLTAKQTGKTIRICKLKAFECVVERKGNSKLGIPTEKVTDLWVASEIDAPRQVAEIFCSRLNIPSQKGIPLRAIHRNNGKMVQVLDTLDVQRKVLPPSNFEPLKNYKKVKDEMGLMMDDSTEDMVNDLLDTSGPQTDLKPLRK